MAVAVVTLIVGFAIYFNNPSFNKSPSIIQQQKIDKAISAATSKSGNTITINLDKNKFMNIDKSQFQKAPDLTQIAGYINTPNNNQPIHLTDYKGKVVLVDFFAGGPRFVGDHDDLLAADTGHADIGRQAQGIAGVIRRGSVN